MNGNLDDNKKPVSRARAAGGKRRSDDGSDDEELAGAVLVGGETEESFQAVLDEHRKRFGELDEVEDALVGDASTLWWRLRRAVAIEASWVNEELDRLPDGEDERARIAQAFGRLAETKKMQFMLRYQATLQKMYKEAMKSAREMQARRCAELCPKPDPTRPRLVARPGRRADVGGRTGVVTELSRGRGKAESEPRRNPKSE